MPKKKAFSHKKSASPRKPTGKPAKKVPTKKSVARKSTAKKLAKKESPSKSHGSDRVVKTKRGPVAKRKSPLGRPKITADEKLYLLFRDDFPARQIFDFLRADTVRDLEQHRPEEIVRRLSAPIRDSIDRIRRRLAEYNRFLSGDEDFVRQHHHKAKSSR